MIEGDLQVKLTETSFDILLPDLSDIVYKIFCTPVSFNVKSVLDKTLLVMPQLSELQSSKSEKSSL